MAGQVEMRRQGMKVGGKERWGWSWMVAAGEPHITSSFFPPLPHSHSHSHSSRIHCTQQLLPHTTRTGGRNLRKSNSTTIYQQHTHKLWRCKAKHNLVDRREEEEKERKGKEGRKEVPQPNKHTHTHTQLSSRGVVGHHNGRGRTQIGEEVEFDTQEDWFTDLGVATSVGDRLFVPRIQELG